MSTYNEHLEFLKRQEVGAIAELQGFISAQWANQVTPYSNLDPYAQQRFEHGYEDGKAILVVERTERETNP
jgi:hypothetical protein